MRIKLDENIPVSLAAVLTSFGHDVDTVPEEGLAGSVDEAVWQGAQTSGRFLITQDLDFSDLRKFEPGRHYGLLVVRVSDPSRDALLKRVRRLFETEAVDGWARCFVVATDRKVRVRRPSL